MTKPDYTRFGISDAVFQRSREALKQTEALFKELTEAAEERQLRVLTALQHAGLTEASLGGSSGYGYDDRGRRALEEAFAEYFGAEDALVRHQFSSGTHVLATCLRGLLRPGDELLLVSGEPYDTIRPLMGFPLRGEHPSGALTEFGIAVRTVDLNGEGHFDLPAIRGALRPATKVIYIQKSRGYSVRRVILNREIAGLAREIKRDRPDLCIMVDNCYGEMTEDAEPTARGADLCAGSLIKNLGAGIADSGAYICGKSELVRRAAEMMTAPGVGGHVGPSLGQTRNLARGFLFAPQVTLAALQGAIHAAALLQAEGYEVNPLPFDERGDIVQLIALGSAEKLRAFCEEIQYSSPVDSMFTPIPAPMPGYDCDIIMASGSFVQGSSIELSCDGPLREPYHAYLQGGLNFPLCRLAAMRAAERLRRM